MASLAAGKYGLTQGGVQAKTLIEESRLRIWLSMTTVDDTQRFHAKKT
jgi:hypothetical protein